MVMLIHSNASSAKCRWFFYLANCEPDRQQYARYLHRSSKKKREELCLCFFFCTCIVHFFLPTAFVPVVAFEYLTVLSWNELCTEFTGRRFIRGHSSFKNAHRIESAEKKETENFFHFLCVCVWLTVLN